MGKLIDDEFKKELLADLEKIKQTLEGSRPKEDEDTLEQVIQTGVQTSRFILDSKDSNELGKTIRSWMRRKIEADNINCNCRKNFYKALGL